MFDGTNLMSHSNTVLTEEEGEWINKCAQRLKLIQADAAEVPPEKRREYLQEEIARTFKDVPAANRKRFQDALLARFPMGGQGGKPGPTEPVMSPAPKPVVETPEQLLDRLLAAAANLPEEKRGQISKRLAEAGFARTDRNSPVLEMSDDLKKRLGLRANEQPRMDRVAELAVFLVEALVLLDQNALKTMRELSSRSPLLNRTEDFRRTAARFLTTDDCSIDKEWNAIRSLLGGLMAALQAAGKDFGRQFVDRMSPSAIEDVIAAEPSSFMGPKKVERYWVRYKELSEDFATPDLVDRKIKECLAAFLERTVHGNR
jgi:hypothetical protein